ncbi:MAG: DUF2796 domain-containing protein [Pseudomonadota bacterium]
MKFSPKSLLIPLIALSANLHAQDDSHVHGIAVLNLVIDQNKLLIEFESPADNIVGFEHKAESDREKAKIKAALKTLEMPKSLIALPASAGCLLDESEVELHAENNDHGEHGEHDDHDNHDRHDDHGDHDDHAGHDNHEEHESSHSEFHARYHITSGKEVSASTSAQVK